jgi:hypothetical protein
MCWGECGNDVTEDGESTFWLEISVFLVGNLMKVEEKFKVIDENSRKSKEF